MFYLQDTQISPGRLVAAEGMGAVSAECLLELALQIGFGTWLDTRGQTLKISYV